MFLVIAEDIDFVPISQTRSNIGIVCILAEKHAIFLIIFRRLLHNNSTKVFYQDGLHLYTLEN